MQFAVNASTTAVANVETAGAGGDVLVDVAFDHYDPASCFGAIDLVIIVIFPGKLP